MKRLVLVFFYLVILTPVVFSQTPQPVQAFNYQAVVRDFHGDIIPNHAISLRISILNGSASGNMVYSEAFNTISNQFGLFTVNIGTGTVVSGLFSNIDWVEGYKWLKVEIDINGGSNYILMGTSQLLSVPYALYAAKSGYSQNTSVTISTFGDTVYVGNSYMLVPGVSLANACRMDFADTVPYTLNYPHAADNPYNTSLYGLPKFILKNYIELDKIDSISRFRSGVGHDYSDSFESCRNMKHYFKPRYDVNWSTVKIYSPVNGTIANVFPDSIWGVQLWITPLGMPAFNVCLFHVNLTSPLNIGDTVSSGQQIGTHASSQTTSDIAISIYTPNSTFQRVSFFDVMTDKLFACYMSRGATSRDDFIISKAARDADPLLPCNGQPFFVTGTINNWVALH